MQPQNPSQWFCWPQDNHRSVTSLVTALPPPEQCVGYVPGRWRSNSLSGPAQWASFRTRPEHTHNSTVLSFWSYVIALQKIIPLAFTSVCTMSVGAGPQCLYYYGLHGMDYLHYILTFTCKSEGRHCFEEKGFTMNLNLCHLDMLCVTFSPLHLASQESHTTRPVSSGGRGRHGHPLLWLQGWVHQVCMAFPANLLTMVNPRKVFRWAG